ncbi:IS66 family insertion sequence element accessory protein TnpB [Sporolactobacillus terrae]|uniref:Transposase n=1 Tax=Sporolactobacillus terrae TaxID=269673 RepID=A0A5K7X033_9BACL|nr:IS66 family insertion sequence element accessory protein TnpB [Sporolactobacillus terrae]RYL96236.1 transposase [Sporolactobacillus sp. THM7-7]BBN97853.1 transposase [Sporolactobacillus terrae]BBN98060.1 transposase [Sporolactobacillus terrae]BBO00012.1 transposase [Sporolactobacillus terrae]BBO00321.1 transposase [Sporolactobacillus terrae]
MIRGSNILNAYLAKGPTDLRKSIDGLSILVQESFHLDPFAPCLFVFCNRKRDKLKILYWEYNGFWLYYKRLEKGTFQWPKANDASPSLKIDRRQLNWLLDGLSINQSQAHREVTERTLI